MTPGVDRARGRCPLDPCSREMSLENPCIRDGNSILRGRSAPLRWTVQILNGYRRRNHFVKLTIPFGKSMPKKTPEELAMLKQAAMKRPIGGEMQKKIPGGIPGAGAMPIPGGQGPMMGRMPGGMNRGMPGMQGGPMPGAMPGPSSNPMRLGMSSNDNRLAGVSPFMPPSSNAMMGDIPGASGMMPPSAQPLRRPTPQLLNPSLSSSGLNADGLITSSLEDSLIEGFQRDELPLTGVQGTASVITKSRILDAMGALREYQSGKRRLETRIVENDRWWRMRHGDGDMGEAAAPAVRSAWLVNSILNKHADAMDNFPEASVLPREQGDKDAAKVLSQVLPVILEQSGFDAVWSDAWWQKLQTGAAVYGVFWNQRRLNGLGDVEVRNVDLLNLFWEPGVRDIQMSRNFFHVEKHPNEVLEALYPKLSGRLTGSGFKLSEYDKDDPVNDAKSSLVVDWYYKTLQDGREVLHFCKLCAGEVLYSSEDDPACRDSGFYAHGKYPFVVDVLFPIKESPAGFGYIDIMKDTQERIDLLGASIVKNARMRATKRFFIRTSGSVNEKEFADWNRELVHTEGALDDSSVREITVAPMGSDVMNAYQALIEELKETSGNRDFSQGGTTGGVTAASAIAALQEAGSKLSRDMLKASYRAFTGVCNLALEVIRQFYDLPRTFRIIAAGGESYVTFDNAAILVRDQGMDFGAAMGQRLPVFDIMVRPQKSNPYSKVAQNEMAMEFYRMGFFNPEMADQALSCMEMMDFDGKDQIIARISEAGGMQKQLQEMQGQMLQLASAVQGMQQAGGMGGMMGAPGGAMGAGMGMPGMGPSGMGVGSVDAGGLGGGAGMPFAAMGAGLGMPGNSGAEGAPMGAGMADLESMAAGIGAGMEIPPQKNPPKTKGKAVDLQAGGLQTIPSADELAQRVRMQTAERSNPMG